MQVRVPNFDFSASLPHWNPSIEFSNLQNGNSLLLPVLEPFLNKVLAKARNRIKPDCPASIDLRDRIATFIQQESNHYRLHAEFNESLFARYDGLTEILDDYKADLDSFYRREDLQFPMGYCEGFECLGPIFARIWVDRFDTMLEGSKGDVELLWKWHWCEEYEHRSVAFDTYKFLFGNGWLKRIRMMHFTLGHIDTYGRRLTGKMLEADRAFMTDAERAQSEKRMRALRRRIKNMTFPRLLPVYSPFYDPANCPEPKNFNAVLGRVEALASREEQRLTA